MRGVLKAMVVVPFAQGFVAMAGFSLIGVPSPILWGVVVVLAAFVPLLGSPLGWVPAVVYLFVYGETVAMDRAPRCSGSWSSAASTT